MKHLFILCLLLCASWSPVEASSAGFPTTSSCRNLISEITHFLLRHKGPDAHGRVHPSIRNVHHSSLELALKAAQSLGLSNQVRPYHARFVIDVWNDDHRDEVLVKRIDALLKTKYRNDLAKLIMETTQDELFPKRFIESIETRKLEISMRSISEHFKGSPFLAIQRYLQLKGRHELADQIRPFHFRQSPPHTWTDRATLHAILIKKIDQLLERKYQGRLDAMISQTNQIELFGHPLVETIDGMSFEVSMGQIGQIYRGSVYAALRDYLELKGLHELAESLKSYHLRQTQRGIWSQKAIRQEILVSKIDHLLQSRYLGDLAMLIGGVTCRDLFKTPLAEEVAGLRLSISMGNIGHRYGNSPYRALKEYLFLKGRPDLAEKLRTYHLLYSAKGTWFSQAIIDEVLTKKIDQLLRTKYHGDIEQLIARTNQIELFRTHLMDQVEEISLPVSMIMVSQRFHGSTALAIRRYLQLKKMEAPPILLKHLKRLLLRHESPVKLIR